MAVLRKGRVIRYTVSQAQATEPPVGKVEMNLFTEAALGPDPEAIADLQHMDHQLWVDGRPTIRAVERGQGAGASSQGRQTGRWSAASDPKEHGVSSENS